MLNKKIFIVLKWFLMSLLLLIVLTLAVRFTGRKINSRIPKGGINTQMYVDINGTKQWISIYGKDINNPVILYLHGGPGSATSPYEYAFTRKWADIYTVVTWDQRNCGKSYNPSQNNIDLTYDLFMQDGLEMTQFILSYLKKEKITLLGHSWGTYLGANLALAYPQYYDFYIGTGQLEDFQENEAAFKEAARQWVKGDADDKKLLQALDSDSCSEEYLLARQDIMKKYGYDIFAQGQDYNLAAAVFFNPYYSIPDIFAYLNFFKTGFSVYTRFINSVEFEKFSLKGKTEYKIPYYNINGDKDYQTNYILAQKYFDEIQAPRKKMFIMKDATHGLLESRSEEFSKILHEIAIDCEHINGHIK